MTEPETPVVAITDDDQLLHIAPADDVLAHIHTEEQTVPPADRPAWDFYTATGQVLVRTTDPATGEQRLEPDATADPPTALDRQLLVDRIDAFLAAVQVEATRDLLSGVETDHVRTPRAVGDLPDVVIGLAAVMSPHAVFTQPDVRDWIHNLGHRIFG